MTTRKRVISIISIISLILAITAGLLLSVGVNTDNTYVGESVRLSNTDVTIDAQTSTKSSDNIEGTPISSSEELQKFIKGEEGYDGTYGYLTTDISLDWSGVGSQAYLASGRTIDGNGNTVTLSDADAVANVSNKTSDNASLSGSAGVVTGVQGSFTDPLDGSNSASRTYGMFVDYNLGTIKNIKFVYSQTSHSVANNSGNLGTNYVGIICGNNSGTITNCDLTVSGGEFGYYYCSGSVKQNSDTDVFVTIFGGIAGRNGGIISNITAQYSDGFSLILNTRGQNSGTAIAGAKASARVVAGGIAGVMYSIDSACSNIIILASDDTVLTLIAQRKNASFSDAVSYREYAAVVPGNSTYSKAEGGIGDTADKQAKVDNIIVDFGMKLSTSHTMDSKKSMNGVVFCGKSTNVTILKVSDTVSDNQHIDYQTDHCNCGVSGNGGQHEAGYGNLIHTGDHSNVTVGFDDEGKQIITVEPKDKQNAMLGEISFTKYSGRGTVTDGSLEPGIEDTATYSGVASNGSTYLYNKVDIRQDKYTFTVRPYQATSSKYWEIGAYSYQIATISNTGAAEYTYTGEDFLLNQLSYTTLVGDKTGVANPECFDARTAEGKAITSGRLPNEYSFVLTEKEAGLSYVDSENQVVAYVEETPTPFEFKVNLAQITPLDASLIGGNWMTTQQDFTFELAGGLEGAADGYQYEVGGSQPTPVNGLVMQNRVDTSKSGRTYKIELTSGGVVVTEPYTYSVKIDLTAPTADIIHYEHPADRYYTHNKITLKADDRASGVASIIMNSYGADNQLDHSHDIISEGIDNGDGTYTWKFQDTGRKEIVVTDNAGHSSTLEVNVKIDTTMPTITVDAYYFKEVEVPRTDNDGNPILDGNNNPIYDTVSQKTEYTSGLEITSAVYFEANATFGESGGEIRYSLDNGHTWQTYDGTLTVKTNADVKFLAVSNTYTHPEDDVYPYPNRYPLANNWNNTTVEVRIQLEQVVITLDDIVIDGAVKTFDGTNAFFGTVSVKDGFEEEHGINGEVQITSVVYADVNASDSVALIISVFCTDDTKVMDNQIDGAFGVIEKKSIDVAIDDKIKIYGVSLPELTYTQSGMVVGFEERVQLYVQKPDGYTGTYELLPQTANGEGYVIAIAEGMTFVNYTIGNVTEGRLRVSLAPVDRLVYDRGQFTGLDLGNIADRNLEIGFIRSNGNYEKLNVTFYARNIHPDNGTGEVVDEGYNLKVDDITKAGAGFFKVVVTLPEFDSAGQPLTDKYVMDEALKEFMIKIIDSTIFDVEEEEEPTDDVDADSKSEQTSPIISNGSNGQIGIYEEDSANTDNTDVDIESAQQKKDYIAMISIFCMVAITMVFAIGVVRAIAKRIRR